MTSAASSMTTIDVRKGDVLEVKASNEWHFYKRLRTGKDIRDAKGILESAPDRLCGWRIVRDGVEVAR